MIILTALLFTVMLAGTVAAADTWQNETVDSSGSVGQYPSLAIDNSGTPHISYASETDDSLKYASKNSDGSWTIETIANTGDAVHSSLAFDSAGNAHVSYYDAIDQNLMYASKIGSGPWTSVIVDSVGNVGYASSLAITSDDNPFISYSDNTNSALKSARIFGGSWTIDTISNPGTGISSSIALDSYQNPHVSYFDAAISGQLKHACRIGNNPWIIETVPVPTVPVADYSDNSIACTGVEDVHISYYDSISGVLMYISKINGLWTAVEIVDNNGNVGKSNSLKIDSAGNPHISYFDSTNKDLKYATKIGSGPWNITTVDSAGDPGYNTCLALNASGIPSIAYYQLTGFDLKYAYLASGSDDPTDSSNQSETSQSGNSNTQKTVTAAITTSENTVGMQTTGAPLAPLAIGLLSLICGLAANRRK
jgi:hypothetical protein